MNKDEVRRTLRDKRSSLSPHIVQQKSAAIITNICDSKPFKEAKRIAYYQAVNGEADPAALNQEDRSTNQRFYLPILQPVIDQGLLFGLVTPQTQYKRNKLSIPEPICDESELITGEQLDLVIVPLLGFDLQGNRLGMGGGFYDRTFAFKQKTNTKKPTLLGFAYDFQQVVSLNAEDWDVPLDMIATETRLIERV